MTVRIVVEHREGNVEIEVDYSMYATLNEAQDLDAELDEAVRQVRKALDLNS